MIQSLHFSLLLCALYILASPINAHADESELPSLAGGTSISLESEKRLGQAFLRQIRHQAPYISDPLIQDYIEHTVYRLSSYSQVQNIELSIIMINSTQINAFAAPGGIMGINAGLILNSKNEAELASVISHELAHLSQRHFARNVDRSKNTQLFNIGALLAAIAIAASSDGDAGIAAISAAQAAIAQRELAYSRQHEREADRIGISTLANAGYSPQAMASFFETLQGYASLNASTPPEYLLTHPLTENRISDAYARAQQITTLQTSPENPDFQFIKARIQANYYQDNQKLVDFFQQQFEQNNAYGNAAAQYGLVLAHMRNEHFDQAKKLLQPLLGINPKPISISLIEAELAIAEKDYEYACELLHQKLNLSPNNYPLSIAYAQALTLNKQPHAAVTVLNLLSLDRPKDPLVWSLLTQAYGQLNKPIAVHRTRAETLFLSGLLDKAITQLEYALEKIENNYQLHARISQRMQDMRQTENDLSL